MPCSASSQYLSSEFETGLQFLRIEPLLHRGQNKVQLTLPHGPEFQPGSHQNHSLVKYGSLGTNTLGFVVVVCL